jgi:hypothetical protein
VNDVVDEAQEAIDEVIPGAGLAKETAPQEIAVQWGQSHVRVL